MRVAPRLRRLGWLRWGLHISVAFALLGLVIWQAKLWELGDEFGEFEVWPAVGAVFINVLTLLLMTLRGQFILSRLHHRVPFVSLLPISIVGNVAGSLTPASTGDLLRTPFFKERHDIPYAHGLATVIYERGFSLFVLIVSTGVAAAWSKLSVQAAAGATAGGLALMLVAPPTAVVVLERTRGILPSATGDDEAASMSLRMFGAVAQSLDSLLVLLRDRWATVGATLGNLSVFAVTAAQLWLVVRAVGPSLSPAEAWTALGASLLAAIATFLPLGIGTLDATVAALVGAAEGGFGTGAAAAVLLRATAHLPLGLAAFGSYLYLASARPAREAAPEVT